MAASTSATTSSAPPSDNRTGYDIFLSHSGAQKLFTQILYINLTLAGYSCFFDQDSDKSLRKGDNVEDKIVNAIQDCKLAVVVLSQEFITSHWPMFELQRIIQKKESDHRLIIYPIFYKLKWKTKREKKLDASQAPTNMEQNDEKNSEFDKVEQFIADSWKGMKGLSGSILTAQHMNEYEFIVDKVFPEICKIYPPRTRYFGDSDDIKGKDHLIKDIDNRFNNCIAKEMLNANMDDCMMTLGVHGIGGFGKTTLCKIMFDWYTQVETASIRMCLLLPTNNDKNEFVEQIKDALDKSGILNEARFTDIDEALSTFIQKIKASGKKIFLAIDNVWSWSVSHVKTIVQSLHKVGVGGKLIVTSRSAQLLETMFKSCNMNRKCYDVVPIPSIKEETAVDALLSYSSIKKDDNIGLLEKVNELVRLCFFNGCCCPLILKSIASRLLEVENSKEQVLDECIQQLRAQEYLQNEDTMQNEYNVVKVLRTSFSLLPKNLQGIFLDIVLSDYDFFIHFRPKPFVGVHPNSAKTFDKISYVCMLHNCSIEKLLCQCERLEFFGLWKVFKLKYGYNFEVHDLYVDLAKNEGKYEEQLVEFVRSTYVMVAVKKYEVDGHSRMTVPNANADIRQFSDLQRYATNFQYLVATCCTSLVDLRGIDSCQALQHLSLTSCGINFRFPNVKLPNLKILTVDTLKAFKLGEGESYICLDEQMPRLEELCVSREQNPLSLEKVLCHQNLSSLRILITEFVQFSYKNKFNDLFPPKRVPSLLSSVVRHLSNLKTVTASMVIVGTRIYIRECDNEFERDSFSDWTVYKEALNYIQDSSQDSSLVKWHILFQREPPKRRKIDWAYK